MLTNLAIAIQIALTGWILYRIIRFLRIHRSCEVSILLVIFVTLTALALKNPTHSEIGKWLPLLYAAFFLVTAFEPEWANGFRWILGQLHPNILSRKGG